MANFKIRSSADKEAVKQYIDNLPDGHTFDVGIKRQAKRRTIPQNRLFHMWCKCIQDDTGQDSEDVKRFCKEQFLGYREVSLFGKPSYVLTPTSSLNTLQMTEFMKQMQAWAATEFGINLPIPEDLIFSQFLEHYEDR